MPNLATAHTPAFPRWEPVDGKATYRMAVPGGWLYRFADTVETSSGEISFAATMAFVPDAPA